MHKSVFSCECHYEDRPILAVIFFTDYMTGDREVRGTLTLFPGATSACVIVDIIRDTADEEPTTFTFTISNVEVASLSEQNSSANVTILDAGQV